MYIIIVIIGCVATALVFGAFYFTGPGKKIRDFLYFLIEGKDKGFSFSNLCLLWRTGAYTGLEDKTRLFWSVPALDECIKFVLQRLETPVEEQFKTKMQSFLTNLYTYRTKVELEIIRKKRRLDSTREIYTGQVCIITVPQEATVYGRVLINTKEALTLELFEDSVPTGKKIVWKGRTVNVYFWREGDAGYIFSSAVTDSKTENGRVKVRLRHSDKIIRTQKRKSVRAECKFEASVFPVHSEQEYDSVYRHGGGVVCTVHDISEDGALFTVKGKALRGVKMKLQFKIKNTPVVMCGKIVRCTYEPIANVSKVNFHSEFLDQKMKNAVLSYVYNIASDEDNEFMSTLLSEYEENENTDRTDGVPKEDVKGLAPERD